MMLAGLRQVARSLTVCTLVISLCVLPTVSAQSHVVSPGELQAALLAAKHRRQENGRAVVSFLSTSRAEKAFRTARIDLNQVKTAIASLSDEELARLAARADKAQADIAAGRLTERDLLIILIGIAALILIIVAVD
jgi:hypothetical protein